MSGTVPVLVFSGPVGVGKSTVAGAASSLLGEVGIVHAVVDLPRIGELYPEPPDDEWNTRLTHENLAALWRNYRSAGATRLVISRVLQFKSGRTRIEEAVPGADVQVVRLQASLEVVLERIEARESGDPTWFREAAAYLVPWMEANDVADFVVDNTDRTPGETAREALSLAGWI